MGSVLFFIASPSIKKMNSINKNVRNRLRLKLLKKKPLVCVSVIIIVIISVPIIIVIISVPMLISFLRQILSTINFIIHNIAQPCQPEVDPNFEVSAATLSPEPLSKVSINNNNKPMTPIDIICH